MDRGGKINTPVPFDLEIKVDKNAPVIQIENHVLKHEVKGFFKKFPQKIAPQTIKTYWQAKRG